MAVQGVPSSSVDDLQSLFPTLPKCVSWAHCQPHVNRLAQYTLVYTIYIRVRVAVRVRVRVRVRNIH